MSIKNNSWNAKGALSAERLFSFLMFFFLRRCVVLGPDGNHSFPLFPDFQGIAHEAQCPEKDGELDATAGNGCVSLLPQEGRSPAEGF